MITRYIRALAMLALVCTVAVTARPVLAASVPGALIVYSQNGHISLMHDDGSGRQMIGAGAAYSWSRDGRYLLLMRGANLLLLNPSGAVLRTLATNVSAGDFPPSWAIDGDTIIYETSGGASPNDHSVSTVDLAGHSTTAWRYTSTEGCGGASPFAPDALISHEVGFDDIANSMQWSITRHLAVYTASCRGGLNVTDTRTGRTQPLDPEGAMWNEPALSPQGTLAVVAGSPTSAPTIVLTTSVPGGRQATVAPGELPLWSPDGHTLYFERITSGKPVPYVGAGGKHFNAPTNVSEIWRMGTSGAAPARLYTQNAYGFGPLSLLAGGSALVFSSVDNVTSASGPYLVAGSFVPPLAQHTRIMRLDLSNDKAATVVIGAGRPVAQP
ncbi:MAG TPA: hypothetical protein VNL71_07750 [Chloroflexota bacterium]|nr:hypothetical protein [Chloroflexota bacterium]